MQHLQHEDTYEELLKIEQYLCPANRNHKLSSLDKLEYHIHRCKELKHPTITRHVYYCQFFAGHLFLNKEERDIHESACKFGQALKKLRDPMTNKFAQILPSGKQGGGNPLMEGSEAQPSKEATEKQPKMSYEQQRHYEYALRKGLIKKKRIEEEIPRDSFEFNKDFKKANELIQLQLHKEINEQQEQLTVLVFEGNPLKVLPLNKAYENFILKRLPYNQYFRERPYYEEVYKNKILLKLGSKPKPKIRYDLTILLPSSVSVQIINRFLPIEDYDDYLTLQHEEFIIANQIELNSQLFFSSVKDNKILLFLSIGKDFGNLFQHCNVSKMVGLFSQFVVFEIDYDATFRLAFEGLVDFNKLENQESQQVNQQTFEKVIDLGIQKEIGNRKAQLETTLIKRTELENQIKFTSKKSEEVVNQRKALQKQEYDLEQQKKVLNHQIDQIKALDRKIQHDLERKNLEEITAFYKSKEQEYEIFLQHFEKLSLDYQDQISKLFESISDRKQNRTKLKNELEILTKVLNQKIRLRDENIKRYQQDLKSLTKSSYFFGEEFVFSVPKNLLCTACQAKKLNIVFLPCLHSCLCRTCYDKFEHDLPHTCFKCKDPIKRVIHLRWEGQLKK